MSEERLKQLLEDVLNDATGDANDPGQRVWPIRASLYREIAFEIGYRDWGSEEAKRNWKHV